MSKKYTPLNKHIVNTKNTHTHIFRYCGSYHPPRECPAYGRPVEDLGRQTIFKTVCKVQKPKSRQSIAI